MTERLQPEALELPDVSVRDPRYPGLQFEPGQHAWTIGQYHDVYTGYLSGDPDIHLWTDAVTTRLSAYRPVLIGVDGMTPYSFDALEKDRLWIALPGRPVRIGLRNRSYVVRGDIYGLNIVKEVTDASIARTLDLLETRGTLTSLAELVAPTMAATTALMLFRVLARKEYDLFNVRLSTHMTRRDFLKIVGGMTTTLVILSPMLTRLGILVVGKYTQSSQVKELVLRLSDAFKISLWPDKLTKFRTAVYLQKMRDVLDQVGSGTPSAMTFGAYHAYDAVECMESEAACADFIRSYSQELFGAVADGLRQIRNVPLEAVMEEFRKNITRVDVIRVDDPGKPPYYPDLSTVVERNMVQKAAFESPRVAGALAEIDV